MQCFYLDTEKENSHFHRELLGKDFDLGIFNSDDSINIAHLKRPFQIKRLRTKNPERILLGNLNINSPPNKFEQLRDAVLKYGDILVLSD